MELFEDDFFEDAEAIKKAQETKSFVVDTTERMGMILDLLPLSFLIHQHQSILFANQVAINEIQLHPEKHVGQHLFDFVIEEDLPKVQAAFQQAFDHDSIQRVDKVQLKKTDNSVNYYQIILALLPWEGIKCIQIFLQNVTDNVLKEQMLKQLSETDPLTKTYNRRSFVDYYETMVSDDEDGKKHVLSILDIDFFKKVNDTFGHEAGDRALIHTVAIITAKLAEFIHQKKCSNAIVARLGGEEFGIILQSVGKENGTFLINEIRKAIEVAPVETKNERFFITASFGMQFFKQHDFIFDDALRMADSALYHAKKSGRNCCKDAEAIFNMPEDADRVSRGLKREPE